MWNSPLKIGNQYGNRTRVARVKGESPRPLDELVVECVRRLNTKSFRSARYFFKENDFLM